MPGGKLGFILSVVRGRGNKEKEKDMLTFLNIPRGAEKKEWALMPSYWSVTLVHGTFPRG